MCRERSIRCSGWRDSGRRSHSDVLNRAISEALHTAPGQSRSRKLVRLSLRQLEKRTIKPAFKFCVLSFWDPVTALAALRSKIGERRLRVALVKQEIYPGLYNTLDQDLRSLLRSSFKHSGPVALFRDCRTEFIILHHEDDTECQVWREKVLDCRHGGFETYLSVPQTRLRDAQAPTTQLAKSASGIDWDRFDLVVSIDVSIPTRIVTAHPQVTWAYYISEPCMSAYKVSQERPLFGYDLFFNQRMYEPRFLGWPYSSKSMDFPYNLQYSGVFEPLVPGSESAERSRSGVFVEAHSFRAFTDQELARLDAFGPVRTVLPSTMDIMQALFQSKYFVRLGGRHLFGNQIIEAVACRCLVVGNPAEFANNILFTRRTSISRFDGLVQRLEFFENHPSAYADERSKQAKLLDYFGYYKPMTNLLRFLKPRCEQP